MCELQVSAVADEAVLCDFGSQELLIPSTCVERRKRENPQLSASPPPSQNQKIQLKEMAVDTLQSIRSARPKDRFDAMGEYFASVLGRLSPNQAMFAEQKLSRAFNDIVDDAVAKVIRLKFLLV